MTKQLSIKDRISTIDWKKVTDEMNAAGYTLLTDCITQAECEGLVALYHQPALFRKTITMERYRFGLGEYKYFNYPLPGLIQAIRENIYPYLAPIANHWMRILKLDNRFPLEYAELQTICNANKQDKPTVLILKYSKGGHNTLHQDLYGELFFPIQLVLFLNTPGEDYSGGEFVLTQQTPRAQSKAIVLQPGKGDMLIFTTNFRPVKSKTGYYRVNMKHGVSEVHEGNRHTVGIIFHDAP